jgi:2-polyprenyl-3-methyl-5-hydroxy-6-metoxy-1,4-benzoquinol methylase
MDRDLFDRKKAATLARQVGVDFGGALTTALAYIGDRLGIFKAMANGLAFTTGQLAQNTGLNERYLREWAATMAAAGYLDYSSEHGTFHMTAEQASVLANEDTTYFTAGAFQYAVACYRQISKLMEAFKHGGGVPFSEFGLEIVEAIERLFHVGYETWVAREWIPAVPDIHRRLLAGGQAAEVGCGAGQCLIPVAAAFPNSRFFGYDVDLTSVERARNKAASAGLGARVSFEQLAAEYVQARDRFDLVMAFNCMHDMAHPRDALKAIQHMLKPDGAFLWSEADVGQRLEDNLTQVGRTLYGASTMHCMTVSLAQGGEGLGSAISEELARNLAAEAGFALLERLPIKNPFHQIFLGRKHI